MTVLAGGVGVATVSSGACSACVVCQNWYASPCPYFDRGASATNVFGSVYMHAVVSFVGSVTLFYAPVAVAVAARGLKDMLQLYFVVTAAATTRLLIFLDLKSLSSFYVVDFGGFFPSFCYRRIFFHTLLT